MKKGFTLIELLGVIVILSLLLLVVGLGVTKIVKNSKSDINDAEESVIIKAAEEYVASNMFEIANGACVNKTVRQLQSAGFLGSVKRSTSTVVRICSVLSSDNVHYEYTYTLMG